MASIPQRSFTDLSTNYPDHREQSHDNLNSFIVAGIIIIVVVLLFALMRGNGSCCQGFTSSQADRHAYVDSPGYGRNVWSGLPHDVDSIETRFKPHTVPEFDAPLSMTSIRHLSKQDYGKSYQ